MASIFYIAAASRSASRNLVAQQSIRAFASKSSRSQKNQKSTNPAQAGQDPSSPATETPKDASSTPTEGTADPASLPSLDFDPTLSSNNISAPTPEPGSSSSSESQQRTGAKSSKGSLSSIEKRKRRAFRATLAAGGLGIIAGIVYAGREWEEDEENPLKAIKYDSEMAARWGRMKARFGGVTDTFSEPAWTELLPKEQHKPYTLVLSLDDLLITSTWDRQNGWRTAKRPGVDYFIAYLSQFYEIVIFTTQHNYTGAPIVEKLDPYTSFIAYRLFRDSTRSMQGKTVKDLSYLNRDLSKVILLDTDPEHAHAQPENSIIIPKWKGGAKDRGLVSLIPFLESIAILNVPDVRPVLTAYEGKDIAIAYAQKEAEMKAKYVENWRNSPEGKRAMARGSGFKVGSLLGASGAPHRDPSLPPLTYLEQKREEAQEYYRREQQWLKDNEKELQRLVQEDKDRAQGEMGGTLLGTLTGAISGQKPDTGAPAPPTDTPKAS